MNTCEKIVNALVARRHELKITQEQLAQACDIPQSMVSKFEKNKTRPQLDTLLKIAHALRCDIEITPVE